VTIEITNPDIPRVDAVNGPATGMPFLILKSQDAQTDPAAVPVVKAEGDDPAEDIEAEDKEGGANIDGTSVSDDESNSAAPASPAWEATDAAKARVIVDALAQARAGIQELCQREEAEGEDGDYGTAWDLEDAESAIDCALAILAKFAVDEQVEADHAQAEAEADARALGLIKSLAERHIAKEAPVAEEENTEVAKADDTMVAVYTADGKLLGAVSADDVTPLNTSVPADSDAATEGDAPADGEADAAPAADAAPVADSMAPAPAAAAPAPAPAPEASAAPAATDETVTKSLDELVAEAVAKALEAAVASAVEPLVKSNEELTERVEKMARTPRDGGPMLSGQRPNSVGPALRGHQDDQEAEELRKQLATETDPGARVLGVAQLLKQGWQAQQ
jgi:hypothetical protein